MSSTSLPAEMGRVSWRKPFTVSRLSLPFRRAIRVPLPEGCCAISSLAACISQQAYRNDHCQSINTLLRLRDKLGSPESNSTRLRLEVREAARALLPEARCCFRSILRLESWRRQRWREAD